MTRFSMASPCALVAALALAACTSSEAPPAPAVQTVAAAPAPIASPAPVAPPSAAPAEAPVRSDYSKDANWLCKPGRASDPCLVNQDVTSISAKGDLKVETFKSDPAAPIDCFYVYPTVSLDNFSNSDLVPGPEEFEVVEQQLARFGGACKMYAPMYRQITLPQLRARYTNVNPPRSGTPADANNDVDDAWAHYLANDNKGRGVVLIGHSQGAGQLVRMIAAHVDGKPVQSQLVSTILLGNSVQVPKGKDVGGSFKSIPVCKSGDQVGCVISYSTFLDAVPPPEGAGFGRGRGESEAICTNPAALAGGKATSPRAIFYTEQPINKAVSYPASWLTPAKPIKTRFVSLPGLIATECVRKGDYHYLEVHVNADPKDPRADEIGGGVMRSGALDASWGLHNHDTSVGIGDLVDIVGKQSAAWRKAHP